MIIVAIITSIGVRLTSTLSRPSIVNTNRRPISLRRVSWFQAGAGPPIPHPSTNRLEPTVRAQTDARFV
jgi:hypothetical protein